MSAEFESVIGLEVHAQLLTQSKMFCSCPNEFNAPPNTRICPICSGQPGSLPVVNRYAIELGVRAALALQCRIHTTSIFARKNYFYPDLPKGYQISQFEKPFATDGALMVPLQSKEEKRVRIHRIHFEEDAGKSVHGAFSTLVNLNRAGVPLIEIVSEPDLRSPHEAGQYLRTLRSILRYGEICDGNMEEGNFRCDANVSIRKKGDPKFGTRVELKNINSFKFVERAIEFEIDRQIAAVESGETIQQQTRTWNSGRGITEVMREKEQAHDYRYFPEPDLPPLHIGESWQTAIAGKMPELPAAKAARFEKHFGVSSYDASVLTAAKELADYFEKVVSLTTHPKTAANWVINELLGRLNQQGLEIEANPIPAENLGDLLQRLEKGEISGRIAKDVFDEMFASGKTPGAIIDEKGLAQVSDTAALEQLVLQVIAQNPSQVADYKGGKTKLFGFFVGQVMKVSQGKANPSVVNELLQRHLK